MRDFLTEFGMTPSSRSRVSSGLPPVRDENAEEFFGWRIGRWHLPVTSRNPKQAPRISHDRLCDCRLQSHGWNTRQIPDPWNDETGHDQTVVVGLGR
jgi:hypothetical protein